MCQWIPNLKFHLGVFLLGNVYCEMFFSSGMLRMHSIQPTLWDVEKVIQLNPVSCVDIWLIYMRYNPLDGSVTSKWILYTGIRNLSRGEFRISFQSISWIVVHSRYYYTNFYLFIFSSVFLCLSVVVLFIFFHEQKDLWS